MKIIANEYQILGSVSDVVALLAKDLENGIFKDIAITKAHAETIQEAVDVSCSGGGSPWFWLKSINLGPDISHEAILGGCYGYCAEVLVNPGDGSVADLTSGLRSAIKTMLQIEDSSTILVEFTGE